MYKHILLPTDGSKLSLRAVKRGIELAKSVGARVTGFYANPGIPIEYFEYGMPLPENMLEAESAREKKLAQKYLAAVSDLAAKAGVSCETVLVENRLPYDAIIAAAKRKRCDLIVMASHGRSGITSRLLAGETTKVLTHSKIPVLVCR
jgi:nucleotide-binding universal stress UspA family protein